MRARFACSATNSSLWAGSAAIRGSRHSVRSPTAFAAFFNIYTPPPVAAAETLLFQLFRKTAQPGGLQQALLGLPEKERKQFKAIREKSACSWWDPAAIGGAWPGLIAQVLQVPMQTEPPASVLADVIC